MIQNKKIERVKILTLMENIPCTIQKMTTQKKKGQMKEMK